MMAEIGDPPEIYPPQTSCLHGINPAVWRRILIRSDSTIADLHHTVQIAFDWTDFHLHRFLIRGREYGIGREGCTAFTTDARKVRLTDFCFRLNERFTYGYDFGDSWEHQIRFEGVRLLEARKSRSIFGGSRAAPLEDCGGAYQPN